MGQFEGDVGHVGQLSEDEKRLWDTERERERKRLYRERKRAEEKVDPDLPVRDVAEVIEAAPVVRTLRVSLEDYIAHNLAVARAHRLPPTEDVDPREYAETDRNVERYARWRYAGVLDGSVGTL